MTKSALEWQIKIRKFVDNELIPWEVHAEKNSGNLPSDIEKKHSDIACLLYTSPSPRDLSTSRMPSSA